MAGGNHHETFGETPPPMPTERSTGLVFAVVASIIAVIFRHNVPIMATAASAALAFTGLALAAPALLAPLNRAWFRLALLLNRFVSPAVMFVLYAILIVPAGLLMQRVRDPLQKRRGPQRATYWIERSGQPPLSSMRDQF